MYSSHSIVGNLNENMMNIEDVTAKLLKCSNPSSSHADRTKINLEEEEEIAVIDPDTAPAISKNIHLSNNVVRWLRGPLRVTVAGIMHTFDLCAKGTHVKESVLQAVQRRIEQEKQSTNSSSLKSPFIEVTSDWKLEGENSDQGFSSSTSWIQDPHGRRLLIKTQELPLGAVNEWLAYVLGSQLGLPVNEGQISVHQNNLIALHTDITQDDEKTITLLELPSKKRKQIMAIPVTESMDILDHTMQNVDRNLRNILVTVPKTCDLNNDQCAMKIRLIDHSSCFGINKYNFISIVATKFHSDHLSIAKFNPIQKAGQFQRYLNRIPVTDRSFIGETVARFAAISDEQLDDWMGKMQDLLSSNQYIRIYNVLRRQRDIARDVIVQWGLSTGF